MTGLWETCRAVDVYAAVVATIGVVFRLTLMMLDRPRWKDARARHLMAWFTYIVLGLIIVSRASAHYSSVGADASWISGARLLLTAVAIALTIWWPHPLKYVHLEGHWHDSPHETPPDSTEEK